MTFTISKSTPAKDLDPGSTIFAEGGRHVVDEVSRDRSGVRVYVRPPGQPEARRSVIRYDADEAALVLPDDKDAENILQELAESAGFELEGARTAVRTQGGWELVLTLDG